MKIFTIIKPGEVIDNRVLCGITRQSVCCNLVPISTPVTHKLWRMNVLANWIEALSYQSDELFIGMDSDVVLEDPDTIKELLQYTTDGVFMATIRSQTRHIKAKQSKLVIAHSLFSCTDKNLLRSELIKLKKNFVDRCPICWAMERILKMKKVMRFIHYPTAYECCRETLVRGEK